MPLIEYEGHGGGEFGPAGKSGGGSLWLVRERLVGGGGFGKGGGGGFGDGRRLW